MAVDAFRSSALVVKQLVCFRLTVKRDFFGALRGIGEEYASAFNADSNLYFDFFSVFLSGFVITFALCGFSNFGSIGIQIGGLSALAPGRRSEFSSLAVRAMCGGALASFLTAAVGAFMTLSDGCGGRTRRSTSGR